MRQAFLAATAGAALVSSPVLAQAPVAAGRRIERPDRRLVGVPATGGGSHVGAGVSDRVRRPHRPRAGDRRLRPAARRGDREPDDRGDDRDLGDGYANRSDRPRAANFAIWWDGDRLRELLDGKRISKSNWTKGRETMLLDPAGMESNNGTKRDPALSVDILGDWHEELLVRTEDSRELWVCATPYPTIKRLVTPMPDPVYRPGVAWQNTGYNQPSHPSFFLGAGIR